MPRKHRRSPDNSPGDYDRIMAAFERARLADQRRAAASDDDSTTPDLPPSAELAPLRPTLPLEAPRSIGSRTPNARLSPTDRVIIRRIAEAPGHPLARKATALEMLDYDFYLGDIAVATDYQPRTVQGWNRVYRSAGLKGLFRHLFELAPGDYEFLDEIGTPDHPRLSTIQTILLSSTAWGENEIAEQLGISVPTVAQRRRRYRQGGTALLLDRLGLPAEERAFLEYLKREYPDHPKLNRVDAVLLADNGWPTGATAEKLGVQHDTVTRSRKRASEGGTNRLLDRVGLHQDTRIYLDRLRRSQPDHPKIKRIETAILADDGWPSELIEKRIRTGQRQIATWLGNVKEGGDVALLERRLIPAGLPAEVAEWADAQNAMAFFELLQDGWPPEVAARHLGVERGQGRRWAKLLPAIPTPVNPPNEPAEPAAENDPLQLRAQGKRQGATAEEREALQLRIAELQIAARRAAHLAAPQANPPSEARSPTSGDESNPYGQRRR